MYTIRTEQYFDSAHFLAGYEGKCANLHGHRWRVTVEAGISELPDNGPERGMVADFGNLKRDLARLTDKLDHTFIYEKGSLMEDTIHALSEEGFYLVEVPFRTTAENFARYFFDEMERMGYRMREVVVYETPNNAASYKKSERKRNEGDKPRQTEERDGTVQGS